MLGTLQQEQIEEVLKHQVFGHIGCSIDGETYIVPISYAYDGNAIYCHTHEGKKTEIMRRNPKVCFQVEEMKNMADWKSVVVQGQYEELTGKQERKAAMQTLLNRYLPILSSVTTHLGSLWPFQNGDTESIEGVVFRIAIQDKTGRFETTTQSPYIPD